MEKYFIARIRGNLHNKTVRDFFLSNFVSKQKMNYLVSNNATSPLIKVALLLTK